MEKLEKTGYVKRTRKVAIPEQPSRQVKKFMLHSI